MAKITATKKHTSGIALGGIGSGSVELLPDGEFHYWLIANQPRLTERCHGGEQGILSRTAVLSPRLTALPLAVPESFFRLGAPKTFDRYAILTSLLLPPGALR